MISVAVSKFFHAAAPLRRRVKTFFEDTHGSLTWFPWRRFYVEA
jgi:hypothetical protein